MKKLIPLFLCLLVAVVSVAPAFAVSAPVVTVTIVNAGVVELARGIVTLSDMDGDGALTVSDALAAAHADYYDGEDGYSASPSDYGISLNKLWGDTSGAFGYMKNDASCLSLADTVTPGDDIVAYIFADQDTWSDTYSYFDIKVATVKVGEPLTLTLKKSGYDANWAPFVAPVSGASPTVNGMPVNTLTDENGTASVTFSKSGTYLVSAVSDETLVPAVAIVTVESDFSPLPFVIGGAVVLVAVVIIILILKKRKHA